MTAEHDRLEEARTQKQPWKKWGPYLSERQWGTVREDYSEGGDAWNYFSHDQARSRAYRWGEDGLGGICDDKQRLCFALALWNGKDAILKERLFGLTNSESNHGEDVKEYYFYLDSTPTHSYLKFLYKYPQAAFPYANLVDTSKSRNRGEMEYELLDTGVFNENRYFDVFVEYAKESPEDILIQITVHNRGPEAAELHVLPTLWFRNQWSWQGLADRPRLERVAGAKGQSVVKAVDAKLGERYLYCGDVPLLFTENETNTQRTFGVANHTPFVKDGIHNCVVAGDAAAVNPAQTGTKASAHYRLTVGPGKSETLRLRLTDSAPTALTAGNGSVVRRGSPDPAETADRRSPAPAQPGDLRSPGVARSGDRATTEALTAGNGASPLGSRFDEVMTQRRREADEFYQSITPRTLCPDEANVMRQALAGMLWSKQFYHYDVDKWLEERGSDPFKATRKF